MDDGTPKRFGEAGNFVENFFIISMKCGLLHPLRKAPCVRGRAAYFHGGFRVTIGNHRST